MTLDEIVGRFSDAHRVGSEFRARCPAHDDKNPSLSIGERNGTILLHCHAGCSNESIVTAVGLEVADLFSKAPSPKIAAIYPYHDELGTVLYENIRFEPKSFRWRQKVGSHYAYNLDGTRRVPYNLPQIRAATDVLVCEGEKDCDTAARLGLAATNSKHWQPEFAAYLGGKAVAIIADADAPGRKIAGDVGRTLIGVAASVKIVELPGAKDLTDWAEGGGTRDALLGWIDTHAKWTPEQVDVAALLDSVVEFIRRFVAMSFPQGVVVALWVAHSHALAAADTTPYLAVTSAEKRSGKTRLLEVIELLVENPWLTARVTPAVLVRKIDAERPSLLLDESDAAFEGDPDYAQTLRGVLNTGHRRGGKASCCVGQGANITYKDFQTFSPKMIAGIGKLPDTVADRAIPIRLNRATRGEITQRFRRRDVEAEAEYLREKLSAWAQSIETSLRDASPELPEELSDRQQDCAEPLLAIADIAGGDWPLIARQAVVHLCAEADAADESTGVRLLADIRNLFFERGVDRLSSVELAGALAEIETSPWGDWTKGKALSPPKLARLLARFGIVPHNIRLGDRIAKGYTIEDFADAFNRYLPPFSCLKTATTLQPSPVALKLDFSAATTGMDVAAGKRDIANRNGPCSVVAVSSRGEGT